MLCNDTQSNYLDVANKFILEGRASSVRISTRPDAVDKQTLDFLRQSGVKTIELGCQSFSDDVLAHSRRGHSVADNIAAVKACKQAGFVVGVQLMPGLPGDLPELTKLSLKKALALSPDFLRIYPTVVVSGTELANLWEEGLYIPWSLDLTVDICAELWLICKQAGVPVIRMGLQHDPVLERNRLDGPYHPAFGQLVRSRLWKNLMILAGPRGTDFLVNPADLADAVGHRRENVEWLNRNYQGSSVVADKNVERNMLRISGQDLSLYSQSLTGE